MQAQTQKSESTSTHQPLIVDRAFFGKDTCITVQMRGKNCYFKWGKKSGDTWNWKNVKFSDLELGELLEVLEMKKESCKFFHSFENNSTQIRFQRTEDTVLCSAGEFARRINSGERVVMSVMIKNIIWMMNLNHL